MTTGVDGPAGQVLVRAMALFTKVVWLQYRSFFSSLSNIRSAGTSTARLVQAALSEHVGANATLVLRGRAFMLTSKVIPLTVIIRFLSPLVMPPTTWLSSGELVWPFKLFWSC